jgi:hypothetical protein
LWYICISIYMQNYNQIVRSICFIFINCDMMYPEKQWNKVLTGISC